MSYQPIKLRQPGQLSLFKHNIESAEYTVRGMTIDH